MSSPASYLCLLGAGLGVLAHLCRVGEKLEVCDNVEGDRDTGARYLEARGVLNTLSGMLE